MISIKDSYSIISQKRNLILIFFGIIYCLISLVNHYNYRTYAFDLGIYNNCLYQYGHFHKNHYPYLHSMFSDFLADHFSLYTIILSPLYYVLGSYTLLIVQILSILIGSCGVYKLVKQKYDIAYLPEIAMIHYLSFFGIYSALTFDYHDNVVSAMLVPWFFYYFSNKKTSMTILFLVLIIIGKENMPIWMAFVCFGLSALYFNDKYKRNTSLIMGLSCLFYFVIIIKFVMPSFDLNAAKNGYHGFRYSALGQNPSEVFYNLLHNPGKIFKGLYDSFSQDSALKNIKKELYVCLFFSGAWMLALRPQYLMMLIPIVAQKVFSDDFTKWGISGHYSIEFTAIIILGFYDGLGFLKNKNIMIIVASCVCLSTIYITYNKMEVRDSIYYNKINGCLYIKEHYKCKFNRKEVKKVMAMIPDSASLSCINVFAPHVSFRKNIYQYPDIHNATYILLATTEDSYPVRGEELEKQIHDYLSSPLWQTLSAGKGIYLFRKKP